MTAELLGTLAGAAGLREAQIHLRRLDGHPGSWAMDDGRWLYPASMIKVPLAVAVGAAIDAGRLRWTDGVTVTAANMTVNDTPSPMVTGYRTTVEELVTLMLQRSDNVATNVLFDVVGRRWATDAVHRLGHPTIFFRRKLSGSLPLIDDPDAEGRNSFPAAEAIALFASIATDGVPQAAMLRRILATSWWDVKLSRGLEPGDTFAHKTGDTDEVTHDGGLLTLADGSRWALVVFTDLPSSDRNDRRFGAFMQALRPHLIERRLESHVTLE